MTGNAQSPAQSAIRWYRFMLSHAKATYLYCSLRRSLSNAVADRDCLLRLQARGDGVEVKERTHWFVSLCVHRMTSIMGTVIVVGIIAKWRHAGLAAALILMLSRFGALETWPGAASTLNSLCFDSALIGGTLLSAPKTRWISQSHSRTMDSHVTRQEPFRVRPFLQLQRWTVPLCSQCSKCTILPSAAPILVTG